MATNSLVTNSKCYCSPCKRTVAQLRELGCGHSRCSACWTEYLTDQLWMMYSQLVSNKLKNDFEIIIKCPDSNSSPGVVKCLQRIDAESCGLLCGGSVKTVLDLWDELRAASTRWADSATRRKAENVTAEQERTNTRNLGSSISGSTLCVRTVNKLSNRKGIRYKEGGREVWSPECLALYWPKRHCLIDPPVSAEAADIVAFYLGLRKLNHTDDFETILNHLQSERDTACLGGSWSEDSHHYIADVFPTVQRSSVNWNSPVVNRETIARFRATDELGLELRMRYRKVFVSFAQFLGYSVELVPPQSKEEEFNPDYEFVLPKKSWAVPWLQFWNHNFMRVSRIVESLRVMEFRSELSVWTKLLKRTYKYHSNVIGRKTWSFWRKHMFEEDLQSD